MVAEDSTLRKISLKGEVVETFEHAGKQFVKVYLHPVCINVAVDMIDQVHLSDNVLVGIDSVTIRLDAAEKNFSADQIFHNGTP